MPSGSGTIRVVPAGAVGGADAVVQAGTGAGIGVGVVVVDTVQIGRRTGLSTCRTQSSYAIVVVVGVGIRRTSCALRCVVAVYRRCWLG